MYVSPSSSIIVASASSLGESLRQRALRQPVNEGEEGRLPRLDGDEPASAAQHAPHLADRPLEVLRDPRQMMQTSVHDRDVLGAARQRQVPAITEDELDVSRAVTEEVRRTIHSADAGKLQPLERAKTVSPSAEELHDPRVAPPAPGPEGGQPANEFPDLLLGCLEAQVRRLPGIGHSGQFAATRARKCSEPPKSHLAGNGYSPRSISQKGHLEAERPKVIEPGLALPVMVRKGNTMPGVPDAIHEAQGRDSEKTVAGVVLDQDGAPRHPRRLAQQPGRVVGMVQDVD